MNKVKSIVVVLTSFLMMGCIVAPMPAVVYPGPVVVYPESMVIYPDYDVFYPGDIWY